MVKGVRGKLGEQKLDSSQVAVGIKCVAQEHFDTKQVEAGDRTFLFLGDRSFSISVHTIEMIVTW